MRRITIFGGAGSIGSELTRQLASHGNAVMVVDLNETALFDLVEELEHKGLKVGGRVGDIRDTELFEYLEAPDIIFHCAALKHVTPSAWSPKLYTETNILGTLNVIGFAQECGAKLINISTDKVVQASSIMAATKRVAEIAVKNAGFISVRFGNVMGSRGSVIPIWQKQINDGQPLTVTDGRMERYMMTIPQACELVIKASEIGKPGQILIMDMGDKVNVLKLAQEILGKSGKDVGIEMIGTRPGETLTEELMTEEEKLRAIKINEFYVI